jgi:hypothetical protein
MMLFKALNKRTLKMLLELKLNSFKKALKATSKGRKNFYLKKELKRL